MKHTRILFSVVLYLLAGLSALAGERQYIWPKGKMADKNHLPYIEWYEAPSGPCIGCMVLISGGAYNSCCDAELIKLWKERFTQLGFQCVNLEYRTPRPAGKAYYQNAWEDGQRALRLIRSEAGKRGFDPEKIGSISMSAGSHLALLLGTSSLTPAYERIDKVDDVPCHLNWAILNAPAYVTTDAEGGIEATREGYGADVKISDIFKFDEKTCPMSLHHGGMDPYSPNGSTLVYRELRKRGIPAEVHLYPNEGHKALGLERAVEFMRQMGFCGPLGEKETLMDRYPSDEARGRYIKQDLWPEGQIPNFQEHQCIPYIEWHFPKEIKTRAIQIVYSGGSYEGNSPDGFEVAPIRRYLNERGMVVVTMKYRTPRPNGLAKHTTAWQDLQRAVKLVRSEAASMGLDPDMIGIMGSSAGGHLTLMGVTSSRHASYKPIDEVDKLPCNVQWGIGIYPAYSLTDGADWHNTTGGNNDSAVLVPEYSFDLSTCPMLLIHGDSDGWASMNSVKIWEKMRSMGIQCELHTLALREHCFQVQANPGTGSYTWMERIGEYLDKILN